MAIFFARNSINGLILQANVGPSLLYSIAGVFGKYALLRGIY